jgi:hypothetical protein
MIFSFLPSTMYEPSLNPSAQLFLMVLVTVARNDGICYALTKKHANHIVQLTESGLTQGARVYDPCGIGITLNSKGGGMCANTGLYLIKYRVFNA